MSTIAENVAGLLGELPSGVRLVAAAKTRLPEEIIEAVGAGVSIIGENYVQEAEQAYRVVGNRVKWHFIGHLQKNKVKKAVRLFDMIETIDSVAIAAEIDKRCGEIDKIMPVLIEVNSGREETKSGVYPESVEALVREIMNLEHVKVTGLMTMGPAVGEPEVFRPYFVETRKVYERLKELELPGVTMEHLSMGMTESYRVAVEEGANIVRIGSLIFGSRES